MLTQTGSESETGAAASCSRSNLIPGFGFIMCLRRTPSNHTRRQAGGLKIAAAQRWTSDVTDISISEEEDAVFEMALLRQKPGYWNYGDIS